MNFTNQDATQHIPQLQNIACELGHYGVIQVSGEDSFKLLQGQLTCDMKNITDTQASIGGICSVKGRLHSVFYIMKFEQSYLLLLPKDTLQHTLDTLAKYAAFFQTELVDASKDYELWGHTQKSQGNVSTDMEVLSVSNLNGIYDLHLNSLFNASILISRKNRAGELIKMLAGTTLADNNAWDYIELQAHLPIFGSAAIEHHLPHNIGLPQVGGVSFDKGCYTGQEIVARMHYRGNLKTHSVLTSIDEEVRLAELSKVFDGDDKKVGELIRTTIFDGKTYCLISLNDKALEQNLFIGDNKASLQILS
ncbi:CAF17-like 4Fe-4S cluster assembly/insertion protein YgfZ [Kangiella sediminilitoris]|uniref:Folate-binding protein YgfZ n=1 Tax=Kangiella sediminilitoris TaxID=1144748 RepID=A0A1B3BC87_9GAMM|nr:folate-binding protein [Kangiella sediminilitoris]AOE50408.1 Folate-binding protein YgfZ [Kangiella sediminilitoris]